MGFCSLTLLSTVFQFYFGDQILLVGETKETADHL